MNISFLYPFFILVDSEVVVTNLPAESPTHSFQRGSRSVRPEIEVPYASCLLRRSAVNEDTAEATARHTI